MNCKQIKNLIPELAEKPSQHIANKEVVEHLTSCQGCQSEMRSYQQVWQMLERLPAIEPDVNYVSRFWTRLATEQTWYEKVLSVLSANRFKRRWAPALATVFMFIFVTMLTIQRSPDFPGPNSDLVEIDDNDRELVENIDLAENFEFLQNFDLLQDLDVIENLESLET